MSTVHPDLLEMLVCPKCHSALVEGGKSLTCTNGSCRLRYEVREGGIPVMLINEARQLDPAEHQAACAQRKPR